MKKLSLMLAVLMVLALFAGCTTKPAATEAPAPAAAETTTEAAAPVEAAPEAQPDKAPRIGFVVFDYSNAYMAYMRKGIENYCADGRATLDVVDSANDQAKQNEQVTTLIQKKVDILIVNLVDPGAGQTILDQAKAADIPVVFVNRAPMLEILDTWDKCWYVGIDWSSPGLVEADTVKGQWVADQAAMDKNGDGILQYVLVQGNISQQDAIYRTKAIDDKFAEWNADGSLKNERLDLQEAGWNTTKAKELMETWIVKYGNSIEAVISNNDAMAMGVIEALRGQGYYDDASKKVWVYGINALPQVWPLLENGELAGTVLTSPWSQAVAAVDICVDVANGREPLSTSTLFDFVWSGASGREIRVQDFGITVETIGAAQEAYGNCS